jgi:hypothetical protein
MLGFREFGKGRAGGGGRVGSKGVSLRATGSRGGRVLSQLGGFQVSRVGSKRDKGEGKEDLARGGKSKGNAPCIVVHCNLCPFT